MKYDEITSHSDRSTHTHTHTHSTNGLIFHSFLIYYKSLNVFLVCGAVRLYQSFYCQWYSMINHLYIFDEYEYENYSDGECKKKLLKNHLTTHKHTHIHQLTAYRIRKTVTKNYYNYWCCCWSQ